MSRLRTLLFVAKDTFRYDKYLHFIRFLLSSIFFVVYKTRHIARPL